MNGDSKEEPSYEKMLRKRKNAFSQEGKSHGRSVSTSRSAAQTNPFWTSMILKVELNNDHVHSFDTRWDETIIAIQKQLDEEVLESKESF